MANRRCFLKLLGAAAAGGAGCAGNTGVPEASGPVPAGNVSALPVGALQAVEGKKVIIGRDAAGLYAMTGICNHEQCDMLKDGSVTPDGISCDCHGSEFDRYGVVQRGPARRPLKHFKVTVDAAGAITIHAGELVAPETRVPAP